MIPRLKVELSPVNHEGPDYCCQQNFISSVSQNASMQKERQMRADHHGKPLSEIPVPRMRAIEISHTVDDVELQEVELDHSPLKNRQSSLSTALQTAATSNFKITLIVLPFHRKCSRSASK